MTYPALATLADVEARLGRNVDDPLQVEALLVDASALVRTYANETWVNDDGELDDVPDGVPGVVAGIVLRAVQNPTGATQETTGPFSVSYGAAAANRLYLTATDKMILTGHGTGRVRVLKTSRGTVETPTRQRSLDLPEPLDELT